MDIKEETKQAWHNLGDAWIEALEETGRLHTQPDWTTP